MRGVVDMANAGFEESWVQEAADREAELNRIMNHLPVTFALRWCEPGEDGCACLGCANGPEAGAGNLAALGFTKAEWQEWWAKTVAKRKLQGETTMRLIVAALRSPARVRLSDFVNDADIGGADSPHIVVEKLQAAIDRAREPATDAAYLRGLEEAAELYDGHDRPHARRLLRALKGKGASQGALHDKPLLRAHVGLAPEPSGEPSSEMGAISYAITLLETEHDWEKCLQYLRAVEDRLAPDEQKDRP